jgi:hypothetical protein
MLHKRIMRASITWNVCDCNAACDEGMLSVYTVSERKQEGCNCQEVTQSVDILVMNCRRLLTGWLTQNIRALFVVWHTDGYTIK